MFEGFEGGMRQRRSFCREADGIAPALVILGSMLNLRVASNAWIQLTAGGSHQLLRFSRRESKFWGWERRREAKNVVRGKAGGKGTILTIFPEDGSETAD